MASKPSTSKATVKATAIAKAKPASLSGASRTSAPKGKSPAKTVTKPKAAAKEKVGATTKPRAPATKAPELLSGGNPRIAKADGDAPVQVYIAAMPGWKSDIGRWLDALIVRSVPNVQKAVKWNSPFYGIEGKGWFLSLHAFTKYVKVAFFRGTALRPVPPGDSKSQDTRYLDIREGDTLDETQMSDWVKQAAALPGWTP